jgi:hypothetical protein
MNFTLLSIDVGIKNLGICLLEIDGKRNIEKILKWKTISLIDNKKEICNGKLKNGNNCKCIGKYKSEDKFYCIKHKEKYSILEKNKKAGDIDIITLGRNIKIELDKLLSEDENNIDYVIIENQISTLASRMKTIQGMIIQYFIQRNMENIDIVSSQNKLKLLKEYENIENIKKTSYSVRKKMGINLTNKILDTNEKLSTSKELFIGKKDDLADSLLQGIYYIKYNLRYN